VELTPGIDEVALALVADAWSRTYRSRAVTYAPSAGPIASRRGVRLVPDRIGLPVSDGEHARVDRTTPMEALRDTLRSIETLYGERTRDAVAMQLEYAER
jgi:hypothetical protein